MVQPNTNYLFIRRFTAKEEKRRLQCGIYLAEQFPQYQTISTQNKINFIDNADHTLSKDVVYGLYVLFNSTLYDVYYRVLNGSTQVNATEINHMPVPAISIIEELGRALLKQSDITEKRAIRSWRDFYMGKISEAQAILRAIGMPERQQTPICALSLLALAHIRPDDDWCQASNEWIRIHDIIQFVNLNYEVDYAENSRETFRKQAMHHFRNAALIEDNGKATNSPNYRYRLTQETVRLLQTFHTDLWEKSLKEFTDVHESLISIYASKKRSENASHD